VKLQKKFLEKQISSSKEWKNQEYHDLKCQAMQLKEQMISMELIIAQES